MKIAPSAPLAIEYIKWILQQLTEDDCLDSICGASLQKTWSYDLPFIGFQREDFLRQKLRSPYQAEQTSRQHNKYVILVLSTPVQLSLLEMGLHVCKLRQGIVYEVLASEMKTAWWHPPNPQKDRERDRKRTQSLQATDIRLLKAAS